MKTGEQPMQPIEYDEHGVIRFRANAIVRRIIDENLVNLNNIAMWRNIPVEDREQFWQMLGYSVSGYGDMMKQNDYGWVRPKTVRKADRKASKLYKERHPQ
jgi:hypothetical protein